MVGVTLCVDNLAARSCDHDTAAAGALWADGCCLRTFLGFQFPGIILGLGILYKGWAKHYAHGYS